MRGKASESTEIEPRANELTKSKNLIDFKNALNKAKEADFRSSLKRHKFDVTKLWTKKPSGGFKFAKQASEKIKL